MTNQEIRAFALAIAEIKNKGAFINVFVDNAQDTDGSIVELPRRRLRYLKAIERYIADDNFRDVVLVDEIDRYCGELF